MLPTTSTGSALTDAGASNHTLIRGESLIGRLQHEDVERILAEIQTASSPLAKTIRNELAQRAADLQVLIEDVDTAVFNTHGFMQRVPADISGAVIAVVRDCMSPPDPGASHIDLKEKDDSETRMSTAKTVIKVSGSSEVAGNSGSDILGTTLHPLEEEILAQGCHLLGLLPTIYSQTIIAAIKTAETPLANLLRRKLKRQALEINSLIQLLDQSACACHELIQHAPPEILESILAFVRDGKNPLAGIIQDGLLANDFQGLGGRFEKGLEDNSSFRDKIENDHAQSCSFPWDMQEQQDNTDALVKGGQHLLDVLPLERAELVLHNIKHLQTPVANAIRLKLAQHKNELDSMLEGVEHVLSRRGTGPGCASPTAGPARPSDPQSQASGKPSHDSAALAQAPPNPIAVPRAEQGSPSSPCTGDLALRVLEPSVLQGWEAGKAGVALGGVRAAVGSGRLLMGLLPPESANAVTTALRRADAGLAVAVRQTLRQHAAGVAGLLAAVEEVLAEGGEMVRQLPAGHADAVLKGLGVAAGTVGATLRSSLARLVLSEPDPLSPVSAVPEIIAEATKSKGNDSDTPVPSPGPAFVGDSEVSYAPDSEADTAVASAQEGLAREDCGVADSDEAPLAACAAAAAGDAVCDVVMSQVPPEVVPSGDSECAAPATDAATFATNGTTARGGRATAPTPRSSTAAVELLSESDIAAARPTETAGGGAKPAPSLAIPTAPSQVDSEDASPGCGSRGGRSPGKTDEALRAAAASAVTQQQAQDSRLVFPTLLECSDREGDVMGRGQVLLRLLPGPDAEAVLGRLGRRRTALSRSLALRMLRDGPAADVSVGDVENVEKDGPGVSDMKDEPEDAAGSDGATAGEADETGPLDAQDAGDVQQVLEEGLELVVRLPADVVDAMLALILEAPAPLAATIRGRLALDAADSSEPKSTMNPTSPSASSPSLSVASPAGERPQSFLESELVEIYVGAQAPADWSMVSAGVVLPSADSHKGDENGDRPEIQALLGVNAVLPAVEVRANPEITFPVVDAVESNIIAFDAVSAVNCDTVLATVLPVEGEDCEVESVVAIKGHTLAAVEEAAVDNAVAVAVFATDPEGYDEKDGAVGAVEAAATEAGVHEAAGIDAAIPSSVILDSSVLASESVLDVAVLDFDVANITENIVYHDGSSELDNILSKDCFKDKMSHAPGGSSMSPVATSGLSDSPDAPPLIISDPPGEAQGKESEMVTNTADGNGLVADCLSSAADDQVLSHRPDMASVVLILVLDAVPSAISESAADSPNGIQVLAEGINASILACCKPAEYQQNDLEHLPVVESFPGGDANENSNHLVANEQLITNGGRCSECGALSEGGMVLEPYDSGENPDMFASQEVEVKSEEENSEDSVQVEGAQGPFKLQKEASVLESSGHDGSDYDSDPGSDTPRHSTPCPRSHVALASVSWTPQPNLPLSLMPDLACASAEGPVNYLPAVSECKPESESCCVLSAIGDLDSSNLQHCLGKVQPQGSGPESAAEKGNHLASKGSSSLHSVSAAEDTKAKHQHLSGLDSRPRLVKTFEYGSEDALDNLRNVLHAVCKRRGIANADRVLSRLIQAADSHATNRLSVTSLTNALSMMHVHLRKYLIRPLKSNPAYFEDDYFKMGAFLEALNSEQWWPLNSDFEDNQENLEKLFRDLEGKFGPKISAALFAGQNVDYLRSLLIEAERDEAALREMRSFVDDRLQRQSIEGLFTKSMLLDKKPSTAKHVPHDGMLKAEQAASPYTLSVPSFMNPRLSRSAIKCDVQSKLPERCRSVDLARTMPESRKSFQLYKQSDGGKLGPSRPDEMRLKQSDGALSKMDPFVASGYLPALSRKKGIEYAKQNTGTAVDNTARFWQKLPFPMHAVKYKRWDLLNNPVLPGFSHPSSVFVHKPAEAWECPKKPEPRCGSRFNESFSVLSSLEVLNKSSMQNADLKVQRLNNKLVLQGGDLLRDVKKLVRRGDFDCALHSAASALQNFKSSGNCGILGTHELGEPIHYVACIIKSQIEKRIKISQSQLERENFERSLEQIPYLLHASRWLAKLQPFDQPAYFIAVPDIAHEARLIDNLTANIIAAQRECALSVEAASLTSYFSSIKEEFDLDGAPTSESVDAATKRKNKLPETIIADGRAYVMVLDAKPADMPAKFQLGTKLKIQGAGVLGSGRRDDGAKPRFGTVTAFNESSSKYKIQYTDEYEWMSWPHTGQYMVEIDIYPEDVEIEIPGFCVQSKTVNLMRSTPQNEAGLIMVVFVVTPCGTSFECSPFGRLGASVTGVKSGKALLDSSQSGVVQILPPLFLLPSSKYLLFDAVHNQTLDQGVAEFVHVGNKQKYVFASGQEVVIPQDGVYNICFRGQTHFDNPSFTYSHKKCIVLNAVNRKHIADVTKVFLNEPLLQKDELRVIISWNSEPLELDLHVYTSSGEHFSDEDRASGVLSDVRIEMDSVTGFGPETVTIRVKPNKSYSMSLCLSNGYKSMNQWGQCNATVALYDNSGIFYMFNLPPSKHSNNTHTWWHVFALDGCKWDKPGHGVLQVNKLMAEEMPQMALPGWRMIYSASHGLWDEFRDTLLDLVHKRIQNDPLMIMPQDISNATSLRGETILGLMCLHNEDEGEDPSNGNEEGETPLQKQIDSARKFLKASERQTTIAESSLSGGLPTYETFIRECKCCGLDECYIFRAISYASTALTLLVLNTLSPVVKRSLPGHGYRKFFENQGESLLLACITRRNWKSVLPVLRGILSIEAVWQRRSTRKFQIRDSVQVEIPVGSGKWLNGIVLKKNHNLYEVGITKSSDLQVQEDANMEHAMSESAIMSDISASQLRWRSRVVDYLKAKCARHRERIDLTYVQAHPAVSANQKIASHIDAVYGEALVLLSDKMAPSLKC